MRSLLFSVLFVTNLVPTGCAQPPTTMKETPNPLLCDPDTGVCAMPGSTGADAVATQNTVPASRAITLLYFTDPICSSCWGAEPQLRRLKMEYGEAIDIQYHMGGLLPSWDIYNSGGISKPSDVAGHWDEVSPHYRMPIIGDVWLEDPLPSSYPPSIAFKAAELQGHDKAHIFLRRLREQVLVEKKNITKWPVIAEAATFAGLDTARLHSDFTGAAPALFQADLTLARSLGVRGFPTFIFSNADGGREVVYGARPYATFEAAVKAMKPDVRAAAIPTDLEGLFKVHASWCAEEVAVALGIPHEQAVQQLKQAQAKGEAVPVDTRNGSVWRRK
ncbi:MAG TPA: DsbA family protein [Flavobacteriales bacterium]|nr:DsbA family protein [Flavobacteriales bacterium]HNI03055.1 DsbA family protein [Flavobacteriales bacterium]HNK69795.1 DsbA family protein [Flavobacteriales bacterium]